LTSYNPFDKFRAIRELLTKNINGLKTSARFEKRTHRVVAWNKAYIETANIILSQIQDTTLSKKELQEYCKNQRETAKVQMLKNKDNPSLAGKYAGNKEVYDNVLYVLYINQ
jgi:hypothetical protein